MSYVLHGAKALIVMYIQLDTLHSDIYTLYKVIFYTYLYILTAIYI